MTKKYLTSDLFFMEKGFIYILFIIAGLFLAILGFAVSFNNTNQDFDKNTFIVIISILSLCLILFGIFHLFYIYKRAKLKSYLYKYGIRTKATIEDFQRMKLYRKRMIASIFMCFSNPLFIFIVIFYLRHKTVIYEFLDKNNIKTQGMTYYEIPPNKVDEYNIGDEIEIIYDPENPKKNFWVDECKV